MKQEFQQWLDDILKGGHHGMRLPSSSELSKRYDISPATICRMMSPYVRTKVLLRVPGKGTYIREIGEAKPQSVSWRTHSAPQRIAELISDEYRKGIVHPGSQLPSVKSLALRYKAGAHTISQAYRILQNSGTVTKAGKRFFFVPSLLSGKEPFSAHVWTGLVYLVALSLQGYRAVFKTDYYAGVYQSAERELRRYGFSVKPLLLDDFVNGHHAGLPDAAGFLLYRVPDDKLEPALEIMKRVGESKTRARQPRFLIDSPFSFDVSRIAGAVLLSRARVFLNMVRLLKQFIINSGEPCIALIGSQPFERDMLYHCHGALMEDVPSLDHSLHDLLPRPDSPGANGPTSPLPGKLRDYARQNSWVGRTPAWQEVLRLNASIVKLFKTRRNVPWVAITDATAEIVYHWATSSGISLGRALKLYTLFNDPSRTHLGITTVDQDWDALGRIVAHHFIGDYDVSRDGDGCLSFGGTLLRREST